MRLLIYWHILWEWHNFLFSTDGMHFLWRKFGKFIFFGNACLIASENFLWRRNTIPSDVPANISGFVFNALVDGIWILKNKYKYNIKIYSKIVNKVRSTYIQDYIIISIISELLNVNIFSRYIIIYLHNSMGTSYKIVLVLIIYII